MSQKTNLNVSPYFDDYNQDKDFYKVLFKPGYPIQARELTTIQSIFQNQVEQFGRHIFQDGSPVIDGQLSIDIPFPAVQIEPEFNGVSVLLYFGLLLGKKVKGSISNVVASVEDIITNIDSINGNYTLYVKYLQSGGDDYSSQTFIDGETLLLEGDSINYFGTTIQSGQGVCSTLSSNSITSGSSVAVKEGIYFIRGFFANVLPQRIFLDQYKTNPTYKVGFEILESVVTSDDDDSLFDNAQGFSNYAAPGADRFKIELQLTKRLIDDSDTTNFVELLRIINGIPQFATKKTQYSVIRDEFARRLADQSGDFYVKPFSLYVRDCLNDRISTPTGVYYDNQFTVNGLTPSEDKMVYEISPGKAYVNGYDVETISPRLLDVPKARTLKKVVNEVVDYEAGELVVVNNAYGSPSIGLGTTSVVSLMSRRIGSDSSVAAGTTIGYARVYDFVPESAYTSESSKINLRLYDVQTFTKIGLTTSITLQTPVYIKGKRSNASGFLLDSVTSSDTLTLYETTGDFFENESIYINGIDDGRLIKSVTDYSISDIKSVYSKVGISTFNADLVLSKKTRIARPGTQFTISADGKVAAGLGTNFADKLFVGNIISYPNPDLSGLVVYNRVESISAGGTNFTVSALESVPGVCAGNLPSETSVVTDIIKIESTLDSYDDSFMTILNHLNVASVDLNGNQLTQRRVFSNQPYSGNSITISITEPDIYFDAFDEDKFLISYADGSIELLTNDKYSLDTTGKQLTFNGLTKSGTGTANVIATVKNLAPNSKVKKLNKTNTLTVNYSNNPSSGIGTTTLNDGLTYSNVYGVRVQDEDICLNVPDVIRILGVFESADIEDPKLPKIKLISFTGPTNSNNDFIIGENIEGKSSGAIAIVINRVDSDTLEYVYLNSSSFSDGEEIVGKESKNRAIISSKILGSNNIISNYGFHDGQEGTFYDYSKIIRNKGAEAPQNKLKIVFQNYTIDSEDTGEFITANSYAQSSFSEDIPSFRDARLSDFIDIRPRVSPYTLSSRSPFEFNSRNFSGSGQYSKYILAPGENLFTSYSYYLPRIDKVCLNQDGTFEVLYGIPDDSPLPPASKANSLDVSTIFVPAYVYDIEDVSVSMIQHKRYRMSDISLLEDRIQRIEEFTVLSSAESKTENYNIKDAATGLDRFKCGFFVDNFYNHSSQDLRDPSFRCAIDKSQGILRPLHYTTNLDLQLGSEKIAGFTTTFDSNADQSFVTDLGSPGIKKSGDIITLAYNEVIYDQQLTASRTENVTAFLVAFYQGSIELNPSIDSWFDEKTITINSTIEIKNTVDRPDVTINTIVNNTTETITRRNQPTQQTGTTPTVYKTETKPTNPTQTTPKKKPEPTKPPKQTKSDNVKPKVKKKNPPKPQVKAPNKPNISNTKPPIQARPIPFGGGGTPWVRNTPLPSFKDRKTTWSTTIGKNIYPNAYINSLKSSFKALPKSK